MSQAGDRFSRRRYLASVGTALAGGLAGCTGLGVTGGEATDDLTIFHAGSLEPPFAAMAAEFEADTGVEVRREPRGSVGSTKKITEQGRAAEVLGVADFRLLRDRVLPKFADWYAVFATNAMAIQYHEDAPGADEIGTDSWWEVLAREDVTIGHSDPAVDPGGYRAVMVQQLGATEFDGTRLYDEATYRRLRENSTVSTGTEINLVSQVESGKLDYVLYYRSIAETTDLPWVDLQPHVDLSKATERYADHYATATVDTESGTFTGAPIAYGVTVPSVAASPDLGARWVERLATEPGRSALRATGFEPVSPLVVPADRADTVPPRIGGEARTAAAMGPLNL